MPQTTSHEVNVALTPAAEASQGLALVQQANGIVIRNKAQHELCREFIKGAKALKSKIEAHYSAIKGPLNAARNTVLAMEKKDLAPVLDAIAVADRIDTGYVRDQQRIEAEAADAAREKAEAAERTRRQKEADKAEADALKLEAASDELSARERDYVFNVVMRGCNYTRAAELAGYKNPEAICYRLNGMPKIQAAVEAQTKAKRIREASEAKQAQPLHVEVVTKPSEVVDGGMRTYFACEGFDTAPLLAKLAADYAKPENVSLRADVDRFLAPALVTLMSAQARQLKDLFPQAWPMARLDRRDGTVGR